MNTKEKLLKGGFIKDSPEFSKYEPHLDKIFNAITDYGYVDKVVDSQKGNTNLGHKDTEEYCVFRVKEEEKANFKHIMEDLNIGLGEENLTKDGEKKQFYSFKSRNLPELKSIIRGVVKTKENEKNQINMAILRQSMSR